MQITILFPVFSHTIIITSLNLTQSKYASLHMPQTVGINFYHKNIKDEEKILVY